MQEELPPHLQYEKRLGTFEIIMSFQISYTLSHKYMDASEKVSIIWTPRRSKGVRSSETSGYLNQNMKY